MQPSTSDSSPINRNATATINVTGNSSAIRYFGDLTPKQQALLRKFQCVGWGALEGIYFENGEPMSRPAPRVHKTIRLRSKGPVTAPRPEHNFALSNEHVTFFSFLREQQNGHILRIEICDGLPAEMSVEEVA